MKKAIIIAITPAALLSSCTATRSIRAEASWSAFCTVRGHHINDNSSETVNEYLDTWCGSADEEEALINSGIETR